MMRVFLAISVMGCGRVASESDASVDAALDFYTCAIPACTGTVLLPLGAAIGADDYCTWGCFADGGRVIDTAAGCPQNAGKDQCDGGVGPYANDIGDGCLVTTCAGPVILPPRASMPNADGCLWRCNSDSALSCNPFVGSECACFQLKCDGG
jgi:hypothetical protein